MIRLFLDNIIYSLQKAGGISVYWTELLSRYYPSDVFDLTEIDHENCENNVVRKQLLNNTSRKLAKDLSLPINIKRFFPYTRPLPVNSIFHSSYQRIATAPGVINVLTIHDLGYELGIMRQSWQRSVHLIFKAYAIKRAQGIICISENTKADLLRLYPFVDPNSVKVIYNGVSEAFHTMHQFDYQLDLPEKYILYVGVRDKYKNFESTVEAVAKISEYSLVIAGSGRLLTHEEKKFLNNKLDNRYVFLPTLTTEELCELYNRALCLLYPSNYEGFGIPILEAMKCDCPVITCNNSSIPEVSGDATLLMADARPETIIASIWYILNTQNRNALVIKGREQVENFSWGKCAEETQSFYKELYERFSQ